MEEEETKDEGVLQEEKDEEGSGVFSAQQAIFMSELTDYELARLSRDDINDIADEYNVSVTEILALQAQVQQAAQPVSSRTREAQAKAQQAAQPVSSRTRQGPSTPEAAGSSRRPTTPTSKRYRRRLEGEE